MTLSRRWVRGAVWVVLLMVGSVLARAQEVSGSISGTVVNASGASVSGAVVTLTNTDRAYVERTLKTDKAGLYTARSLPLGTYSLTVAMQGFKTFTETGIVLNANDALKVDGKLAAGSATETVTLVANKAQVNLENGMSEGLITGTQIHDLPLVTRNYEQLLTLQPGVMYAGSGSDQLYIGKSLPYDTTGASQPNLSVPAYSSTSVPNQVLYSINGLSPSQNSWTLDGGDNVDHGTNLQLLSYPSVDAISEMVTLRGTYEAEYGHSASGQINVVTKSGTNDFHGSVYEYLRNDALNANNFFNNLTGVARSPMRYNDFGFTLGGPVVIPHHYNGKDKLFFFFSQEFRREVQYASVTAYAPTSDERNGIFTNSYIQSGGTWTTSPVAVCQGPNQGPCQNYTTSFVGTTGILSPTAQAYVHSIYNTVPLPNSARDIGLGLDPHTEVNSIRNLFNDSQQFARLDYALNSRTNLFYRIVHDSLPSVEGGGLFVNGGLPGVSTTHTKSPSTQELGHITIAVHPSMLLDLGYAYTNGQIVSTPDAPVSYGTTLINPVLPFPSELGVVPSISFSVGNMTGITSNGLYADHNFTHNGFGSITKIKGPHTLKFGLDYTHYERTENNTNTNAQGNFTFAPALAPTAAQQTALGAVAPSTYDSQWGNFLIGNASGGFSQASVDPTADMNQNMIEFYGQDDWRVSPRLTVNLGVRYSYFAQPSDNSKELSNFDPALFNPFYEETISSTGSLCTIAGQTSPAYTYSATGVSVTYTLANCPNANGLNPYQPNLVADPVNGMILGNPDFIKAEQNVHNANYPFKEPVSTGTPSQAQSLETHGSPFGQAVGQAEKHDWAPRLGFAYDLLGDGKTVLRGGYGIAYDNASLNQYELEVFNNPPYTTVYNYTTSPLDSVPTAPGQNLAPPTLYATPVIFKTPYVQQYSLDVQAAIDPTTTLDLAYFGNHGTHLQGVVDINEVQPGAFVAKTIGYAQGGASCIMFNSPACEAPLNQIRPYLGYTAINAMQNVFNSNYNSLQFKVTKRFSGKSLIDANYTWSRGITNSPFDTGSAAQNTYNLSSEYGASPLNRNSALTVDGVWELPWMKDQKDLMGEILGGWEMTGIFTIDSGLPLTATMAAGGTVNYGGLTSTYNNTTNGGPVSDAAGLGILQGSMARLRPNVVLNPNQGYGQVNLRTSGPGGFWFNPTAFVAPSPTGFQLGNERPGAIIGPGIDKMDFGLFKTFRVYHATTFTLRGEAFNVLNHVNWGSIDTVATDSQFGRVTSTRDPRILQVAGKINF